MSERKPLSGLWNSIPACAACLGALSGLTTVGSKNCAGFYVLVAKETIGGLGFRPIRACLVDGTLR